MEKAKRFIVEVVNKIKKQWNTLLTKNNKNYGED